MISWGVIMAKLENGTSVEELAQLAGTTYKNMWNRIRRHEVKDGVIYMKENQLRSKNNSKKAPAPKFCPVTRAPRQPEECKECFNEDCKGKEAPEEKPVFLTKKLNLPEGKPALHCQTAETAEAIDWSELEDFPEQCKNCHSYQVSVKHPGCANYETCEIVKGGPFKTVQQIGGFKVSCSTPQLEQELKAAAKKLDGRAIAIDLPALTTPKITVAKQVYAEIERQIDHCEEMIEYAKRTWTQMEKERRSWEAILNKIIPERSPEEDGEESGGES